MITRHLFKVYISIDNGNNTRRVADEFTGKLVKSLLIDGNPKLRKFFEKVSGGAPKLIRITPLYVDGGRLRCIHSVRDVNNGRYHFYVGFAEAATAESPTFDGVYAALMNISGSHRYRDRVLDVELLSVETMDVEVAARSAVSSLRNSGRLRVVFASPTLLRDPLRAGKHKSLTPTPVNIFSTPVYINLYLLGRLRQRLFIRTLVMLHRLLNEPYSIHRTTKVIKVKYDDNKNPIPALIGYANLYLNKDYYKEYTQRGIDVDKLLQETMATMLALGTGTSRATGFGHITTSGT